MKILPWAIGAGIVLFTGTALAMRLRGKPARAMSLAEAQEAMRAYANRGLVTILDEGPRMTVGGVIAGVQHSYLDNEGIHPRGKIDNLDPRFGVYLVRLDQMLRGKGVTELLDAGITHGGGDLDDVHNQGRAIDLVGLRGPRINLSVLKDWGRKPEILKGGGVYRLGPLDDGYYLFRDIYNFGAREGADVNTHPEGAPPSRIGYASYLITPDQPSPSLHAAHQNHMHMQLGRTRGMEP